MPNRPPGEDSEPNRKSNWNAARLAVAWERNASNLLDNLREFFFAPPVRVLRPRSMPLHAECIWSRDALMPRVQGLSLGAHVLIVALAILPLTLDKLPPYGGPPRPPFIFVSIADLREILAVQKPQKGSGGGGDENPVPTTRGRLAPVANIQIVAPGLPKNENPDLPVLPTLVGPPDAVLPNIVAPNWGLPDRERFTNSDGPGKDGGQGEGRNRGQGRQWGPGTGDDDVAGIGWPRSGVGVTDVVCEFCPNPAYTEEARKAKFNGSVMLRVVVGADGLPGDVRVTRGAGYGLDESAVRAVRQWKFRPARDRTGRAVTAWTFVEVNFRIY